MNQSYTYFTWRNTKQELIDYLHELTKTEVNQFFRPNFWTNTPDILSQAVAQNKKISIESDFTEDELEAIAESLKDE